MKYTAIIMKTTTESCKIEIEATNIDNADTLANSVAKWLDDTDTGVSALIISLSQEANDAFELEVEQFEVIDISEGGLD